MMHEFSHAFCRFFIHTAFLCRLLAKLISFLVTKPEMHTARFYGRRGGDVDDVDSGSSSDEDDISMDADSDDEFQPTNSDISSSEFSSSESDSDDASPVPSTHTNIQQPQRQNPADWKEDVSAKPQIVFSGRSGLMKTIVHDNNSDVAPIEVFLQFFDDSVIELMVIETNRYAQQYVQSHQLRRTSRMARWTDTTKEEMKTFLGLILLTGLIQYPTIEDYWKKDPLYYHPLFHQVGMSYNRFALLLKNWHVGNNLDAQQGDRLHKVSQFVQLLISNIQSVYVPAGEISVDETMISHRGRLLFRQYNPGKAHKYGIKLFKLAEMTGYVWNISIYCGKGTKNIITGLDHPGSVVVTLAESLLNEGRLLVADNWYSSIPLANYLREKNTEYCGTMRSNRKGIARIVKNANLKKGDIKAVVNNDGVRVMNYKDKKNVYMISTFHGPNMSDTGKRNRAGNAISKPQVILDYNDFSIDFSDQMIAYYSPARKSVKWYRKVIFECISIAVQNSFVLYRMFYCSQSTCSLESFVKSIAISLLQVEQRTTSVGPRPKRKSHALCQIPRRSDGKISRKRCHGCYEKIAKSSDRKQAVTKAKQVSTECMECKKPFCLQCFNDLHEKR